MLKLVGEKGITGYLHSLKISNQKTYISFKGIQSNFTVEKAGRYRLIQVIKVNITSDGTGCHPFSVDRMQEQSSILKEISPGCSLEELMLKLKL